MKQISLDQVQYKISAPSLNGLHEQTQNLLARSPLFSDLDSDIVTAIAAKGKLLSFDKNEVVISEGSSKRMIGFVVSGLFVCRRSSPAGMVFAFQNARPGAFFCELSLISDNPCGIEVISTSSACKALMFAARDFRLLMEQYPVISSRMVDELTVRINSLSELSFELATMKIDARLRKTIGKLARETNQLRDGGIINPAPTHAELATMLGTTREVVSRSLTMLCREGLIETSRQAIMIRSVDGFN
ncbi:Crp/Fnr family transcriptional regulator [Agrobacterium vitis]|uniref:Crp/Fnr family transcriptional regulator n=1 Tax=Agrobacterium vitis TaxID=373 RepID=UPI001F30CACE|nr:Crp/Fnr family transcriptional regulator [Agrobacterium vitis]MCF1466154.1 Crp/Fnr family transcriptional regulator [Agrobacterium vitis]